MNIITIKEVSYNLDTLISYHHVLLDITPELSDGDICEVKMFINFPDSQVCVEDNFTQIDFLRAIDKFRDQAGTVGTTAYYVKKAYDYHCAANKKESTL